MRVLRAAAVVWAVGAGCGGSTRGAIGSNSHEGGSMSPDAGASTTDSALAPDIGPSRGSATGGQPPAVGVDAAANTQGMGNGGDCTNCAAPTPVCCAAQNGATCVAAPSACPTGTMVIACTDATGCGGGQVCCEGNGGTTSCASTCPTGHQVCQANSDCPSSMPVCDMNGPAMDLGYGFCIASPALQGDSGGADTGSSQPADAGGSPDGVTPADAALPVEGAAGD